MSHPVREHCPRAKPLPAGWCCPCHGTEKGRGRPSTRPAIVLRPRPYLSRARAREANYDDIANGVVKVLKLIDEYRTP